MHQGKKTKGRIPLDGLGVQKTNTFFSGLLAVQCNEASTPEWTMIAPQTVIIVIARMQR